MNEDNVKPEEVVVTPEVPVVPSAMGKHGQLKPFVFGIMRSLKKANKLDEMVAAAVVAKVKERFPNSKFDKTHVNFYKHHYLKSLRTSKKAF